MKLLIVDAQKEIVHEQLYHMDVFVSNVQTLIEVARKNAIEVIYIRHDDGEEEALTKGASGFEIDDAFTPLANEKVFDKTVNSPFIETTLLAYLKAQKETTLIVAGLQTEYCIDATIKSGFEHGFHMVVPAHANTTIDNAFMSGEQSYRYYNEHMWPDRYARCLSMEETLHLMKSACEA